MDILMVAVATGAGYVAQHLKSGGRATSELSSENSNVVNPDSPRQPPNKKCPFRRLVKREKVEEDVSEVKDEVSRDVSNTEVASTSGIDGEKGAILHNYEDGNVFSASSLFPGFIGSDGALGDEGVRVGEGIGDWLPKPSSHEIGPSFGSPRNRSILRSRRTNRQLIRPLSSLESCLMAQLYKEHAEMEEHVCRSTPLLSTQTMRPFFVTDGSKVISRASNDSFLVQNKVLGNKPKNLEANGHVSGVPPLPNLASLDIRGKSKVNNARERRGRSSNASKPATGEHSNLPSGSSHGTLLLCLGMAFGIISSFMANRREVEKLNELLKQTENLVQDLQEELEMKDLLTVQELSADDYKSQEMHDDHGQRHSISHEHNLEESTPYADTGFLDPKEREDSLTKIEAELEAELEMLEMNMTSSTLDRKFLNLVEVDPDFVPDIVQGELRADMFGRQGHDQPYADRDGSGSTTAHSANYAVSPRELSLRLHELLQLQLEERIKELEAEIENKQKLNPESWKDYSSSDAGEQNPIEEPVVLNLSGEALDAYNEAYDEFAKIDESEEEDLPLELGHSDLLASENQVDQNFCSPLNGQGSENHYVLSQLDINGTPIYQREEDNVSQNGVGSSGDEKDFGEDEMLLIKNIVEKARKGSPVVLNAQRALFSMDFE